jgi:secreted trypsin-like serine protease
MVMQLSEGRRVLVGVASATDGNLCAKGGGVAIYTNLSTVRDFIDTQIQRFTPEQRLNAS